MNHTGSEEVLLDFDFDGQTQSPQDEIQNHYNSPTSFGNDLQPNNAFQSSTSADIETNFNGGGTTSVS